MSLAQVATQHVKRGLWTDHERGAILGKIITTDTQTGNIIVALLAVLTTLGTAHLWNIVTFLIHQVRADGRPTDALFRQQQALLRTAPPPSAVVTDSIKLCWTWRGKAKRPLSKSLLLLVLAALFTAATIAASVFSSLVVDSSNLVVLVQSDYCGWHSNISLGFRHPWLTLEYLVQNYARDCYHTNPSNSSQPKACEIFKTPNVDILTEFVDCPFGSMCGHDEAYRMDSGIVDVNEAFGLNLQRKDRVRYRKTTTCQVIPLDGYTEVVNGSDWEEQMGRKAAPDEEMMLVNYGGVPAHALHNRTLVTTLLVSNLTFTYQRQGFIHYATPMEPLFSFINPVPELRREDGDTMLLLHSFASIGFHEPVNDPLFTAHKVREGRLRPNGTYYEADYPVRALSCLLQYQFCHDQSDGKEFCTELRNLPTQVSEATFPHANELQLAVLKLLVTSSYTWDYASGPIGLLADDDVGYYGIKISLPDDQWAKELLFAEQVIWAGLQAAITDYAVGPIVRDPKESKDWVPPATDGEKQLCGIQRMRKSGDVVNISVFALVLIIIVAGSVALIDITLLKFLIYMSRFRRALAPRIDRWIQDGVWQLQRRAYESQGHRDWTDIETEIPVTTDDRPFQDLPSTWVPEKAPTFEMDRYCESASGSGSEKGISSVGVKECGTPSSGTSSSGTSSSGSSSAKPSGTPSATPKIGDDMAWSEGTGPAMTATSATDGSWTPRLGTTRMGSEMTLVSK